MTRDINKAIKEGEQLLAAHPRADISLQAAREIAAQGGVILTIMRAFAAGVAVGARLERSKGKPSR